MDSYTKDVMRDGLKNQKRNPEVPADVSRSISLLNEQLFALKALTNLLKNAYQGLDVAWDMDEVFHGDESSGVGPIASSGDGSDDEDSDAGAVDPQTPFAATTTTTTVAGPAATTTPSDTAVRTDVDGGGGRGDGDDDDTVVGTTNDVDDTSSSRGDAGSGKSATLQKAVAAYLLPVVAVWFGGSFLEWIL